MYIKPNKWFLKELYIKLYLPQFIYNIRATPRRINMYELNRINKYVICTTGYTIPIYKITEYPRYTKRRYRLFAKLYRTLRYMFINIL